MIKGLVAAVAIGSAVIPAASRAAPWTVGAEREVDEGWYFKLAYHAQGWRVWRIEYVEGVVCKAIKSAKGRPHPEPLGFRQSFWLGTPYLMLTKYRGETYLSIEGKHGREINWRDPGAKFWTGELNFQQLEERDGKPVEISVDSWEYPDIHVGLASERGVLDLTGYKAAMVALSDCAAKS